METDGAFLREVTKYPQATVTEFFKFMVLKAINHDVDAELLSPSGPVDQVWHECLLYTKEYYTLCYNLLEAAKYETKEVALIHHNPRGAFEGKERMERLRRTYQSYEDVFGTKPPTKHWPKLSEMSGTPQDG